MYPTKHHPIVTHAIKAAATASMVLALTSSAFGQSGAKVPFDLDKFKPVLSQSKLHNSSGGVPKNGNFDGFEVPGRFYLGEGGNTMVFATDVTGPGRVELMHKPVWSLGGAEKHYSARLRMTKPVAAESPGKRNFFIFQVYGKGKHKGPIVLVSTNPKSSTLSFYIKGIPKGGQGDRERITIPEGFFDLDVKIKDAIVQIFIDGKLQAEGDLSRMANAKAYFKTGCYQKNLEPNKVEFEKLTITTP